MRRVARWLSLLFLLAPKDAPMDNITSTDDQPQPNQPSDSDVQVRIAGLADACARQITDIATDVQDTMLELAERFNEVRESTDPVDFWQLILEHVDDNKRQSTIDLFGDDIAEIIALPLDVLRTRIANVKKVEGRIDSAFAMGAANARIRSGEFTVGQPNYVGQFDMAQAIASRGPLRPKTHRDRMRALVAKLLAESPKVEDPPPDDIGAI